jgi:hypothetical protein
MTGPASDENAPGTAPCERRDATREVVVQVHSAENADASVRPPVAAPERGVGQGAGRERRRSAQDEGPSAAGQLGHVTDEWPADYPRAAPVQRPQRHHAPSHGGFCCELEGRLGVEVEGISP